DGERRVPLLLRLVEAAERDAELSVARGLRERIVKHALGARGILLVEGDGGAGEGATAGIAPADLRGLAARLVEAAAHEARRHDVEHDEVAPRVEVVGIERDCFLPRLARLACEPGLAEQARLLRRATV